MRASNKTVAFATGNRGKMLEARLILSPFGIRTVPFNGKGVEIQADEVSEIARYAAREASRKYQKRVIVEDAGLFVDALGGFPGPFSSYVFKTIGIRGLLSLMEKERSRRASFRSAVSYCEPAGEPVLFEGAVGGTILTAPEGKNGFGFDPIFVPDGSRMSLGEMTLKEKCSVSHRGEAMRKFGAWFVSP